MRCLLAAVVILACAGHLSAEVVVVVGKIEFGPDDFLGYDYRAKIAVAPALDPGTAVFLESDPPDLEVVAITLANSQNWYLVEEEDVFSEANIAAGRFPVLHSGDDFFRVTVGMGDFYLGVTAEGPHTGFERYDVYGWVKIGQSAEGLTQLDDAMAYRDRPFRGNEGIIVGTTTVVPEPATWLILVVGCIVGSGWWLVKRRGNADSLRC